MNFEKLDSALQEILGEEAFKEYQQHVFTQVQDKDYVVDFLEKEIRAQTDELGLFLTFRTDTPPTGLGILAYPVNGPDTIDKFFLWHEKFQEFVEDASGQFDDLLEIEREIQTSLNFVQMHIEACREYEEDYKE